MQLVGEDDQKPVILISGSSTDSASVRAAVAMVRGAHGVPKVITDHAGRSPEEDLKGVSGVLILGNDKDLPPPPGEKVHPKTQSELDSPDTAARAAYENKLLPLALERKIPTTLICAGMQRLGWMHGARLQPHLPDMQGISNHHNQADFNIAPFIPTQSIAINKGSLLGDIAQDIKMVQAPAPTDLPVIKLMDNSFHHQGFTEDAFDASQPAGQYLRVAAVGEDVVTLPNGKTSRLVEAIEANPTGKYGDQFLVATQFHPEFGASELGSRIADRFVTAARKFLHEHPQDISADNVVNANIDSNLPKMKVPDDIIVMGPMTAMLAERAAQAKGKSGYRQAG